jgi:nicotinamide mononucleotide (NMN) deamidase PncC
MAAGRAGTVAGATLAVSITGIAGPGGSEHKPEGRVCFGLATRIRRQIGNGRVRRPGRAQVRAAAVDHALAMLLRERNLRHRRVTEPGAIKRAARRSNARTIRCIAS